MAASAVLHERLYMRDLSGVLDRPKYASRRIGYVGLHPQGTKRRAVGDQWLVIRPLGGALDRHHLTQQEHMVAARIAARHSALNARQRLIEERDLVQPRAAVVRDVVEKRTLPVRQREASGEHRCRAVSRLTAKHLLCSITGSVRDDRRRLTSTSGGWSEIEQKALTVRPRGSPPAIVVTTVTPEANRLIAWRKTSGVTGLACMGHASFPASPRY
jgi:hypothetical protein